MSCKCSFGTCGISLSVYLRSIKEVALPFCPTLSVIPCRSVCGLGQLALSLHAFAHFLSRSCKPLATEYSSSSHYLARVFQEMSTYSFVSYWGKCVFVKPRPCWCMSWAERRGEQQAMRKEHWGRWVHMHP